MKEITNKFLRHSTTVLRNIKNDIFVDVKFKIKRCKEYVERLFDNAIPQEPPSIKDNIDKTDHLS